MSRSVSYRGEVDPEALDADEDGILDGYENKLASITYYSFENRLKGEEITDYTKSFNSSQEVTSTVIYLYEAELKRADDAGSSDRMSRSVSYRGEVDPEALDADEDGILDGYENKLASITYYSFENRLKGEEITDYTKNFVKGRIKSTTIYLYEAELKRAEYASPTDRLST